MRRDVPVSRQILLLLVLAFPPAVANGWWRATTVASSALRPYEVTAETVAGWKRQLLWIDARSEEDYQQAHITGALPLRESQWEEQLAAVLAGWEPEHAVVVYCAETSCATSERVAERLRGDLGSADVYFLQGGFEGWQERRQ